jgi:hypothetical protein
VQPFKRRLLTAGNDSSWPFADIRARLNFLSLGAFLKYLALIGLVSLSMAQASQFSDFWTWFQVNQTDFPPTTEFDEMYGNELSGRLEAIKLGLVYEISIPDEGEKELVISADGISELIPFVQELVKSAPDIEDWKITAFRPRMDDYARFALNYDERNFDPKELWCYARIEDGHFDLIIYHPDYSDDDRNLIVSGAFILLDMALGEYDVMTGIRYIDHQPLPADPEPVGLYRFEDLRSVFDKYKSTTEH